MQPGTRLGPYEIVELLGAGGMGQVWLGRDTRLGRKVAIKVLPSEFAGDRERLARFEQEARAAAALSHPNIAAVHDVGHEAGTHFIVQEYIEGRNLRQAMEAARLPLPRALALATQIADALAAAHAAGIIHRDIKPENVFVTADGHAKVLDFGLAKLTESSVAPTSGSGASMSPTLLGTMAGQVLGTAGYMAPEQIDGTVPVDRRADVFAFGTLLYELASGRRAFGGRSVADTLARIQHEEPVPLAQLDASLPRELARIVAKALAKDPAERYQHMDDLTVDLRAVSRRMERGEVETFASGVGSGGGAAHRRPSTLALGLTAAAALILGTLLGVLLPRSTQPQSAPVGEVQFVLGLPAEVAELPRGQGGVLAIAPDGSAVAFAGMDAAGNRSLYVRRLDAVGASALPGIANAQAPAFDKQSTWITVGTDRERAVRVQAAGGEPFLACANCSDPAWADDGKLYYSDKGSLWRQLPDGGERELVSEPLLEQGVSYLSRPDVLPGSRAVVFEVGNLERGGIAVLSLPDRRVVRVAADGSDPFYSTTGHILFARESTLFAVPFDAETLEVKGPAVPVLPGVRVENAGALQVALADNGTLAYVPAPAAARTSLVRVASTGEVLETIGAGRSYVAAAVSPDGSQVATVVNDAGRTDLWLLDLATGQETQLTTNGNANGPVWSSDGTELLFGANDASTFEVRRLEVATRRLSTVFVAAASVLPMSWGGDGETALIMIEGEAPNLYRLNLGDGTATAALEEDSGAFGGMLSPDGSRVAYESGRTGSREVFVRELATGRELMISTGGGQSPFWSQDGTQVYFRDTSRIQMAVATLDLSDGLRLAKREGLLATAPYWTGATGVRAQGGFPDGSFVLVRQRDADEPRDEIHVILNFADRLRRTGLP